MFSMLPPQPGNIAVIVDGVVSVFFGPRIGKFSGVYRPWKGVGYVDPLASLVVMLVFSRITFGRSR